jgi:ribosomal-protein-alanine N-acetyltransferase
MSGEIPTERLRLVPVTEDDEARLWELLALPEVRRYLCDDSVLPRASVAAMIGESLKPASITTLWRVATEGADCIGLVGLRPPSQGSLVLRAIGWRSLELVIALAPHFRGWGLATEAVDAVAAYAGQDGVTFALVGCVDQPDQRSHRLMRRCGFSELGRAAGLQRPLVIYERPL